MKTQLLSIMLVLALVGCARANLVDSNSITKDGIEYYVQTDNAVYNLGENVEILYRVTNLREEEVTFSFPGWPEWNFWVEKDQENIWTAVSVWYTFPINFTLSPGEYKQYPLVWDMRDYKGNLLVDIGEYSVIGGFDDGPGGGGYDYSKVSVDIMIVPEPSTIVLLALGLGYILFDQKGSAKHT